MNDIEQRIRELPLPEPSEALDGRMAELFSTARLAGGANGSRRSALVATALAAGVAGFAAGLGTGEWFLAPQDTPSVGASAPPNDGGAIGAPASYVQLTDSRIGAGLDFSQSLERFQVQLTTQEGS